MIDTKGIPRARLLAALYNRSQQLGMGVADYRGRAQMSEEQAQAIIDDDLKGGAGLYYDYLQGRVMKIDIAPDEIDERLYDRDLGEGACAAVVASLR